MTEFKPTLNEAQVKTCRDMIASCNELVALVGMAKEAGLNGKFYLVNPGGQMVIFSTPDNTFRFVPAKPDAGYTFDTFARASHAKRKWNDRLTPAQRAAACEVHVASHAQYLENILTTATEMKALMIQALAKAGIDC